MLWAAATTSVVGCAYTTLSFARSLHASVAKRGPAFLAVFILGSLAVYAFVGRPVRLLVLAGALNGLILPATLGVVLVAARRRDLVGEYRHPAPLLLAGWIAFAIAVVGGALAYVYCDGATLSTLNFNTFSQVAFDFRVTGGLLARGLGWALVIGLAGGLPPAVRAARLPVTVALRTA